MIFPYANPAHWWIAGILERYRQGLGQRMTDRRRWNTKDKAAAGRLGRLQYERTMEPQAALKRLPPGEATLPVG